LIRNCKLTASCNNRNFLSAHNTNRNTSMQNT
jgi:hypothetical protein